MKHNGLCMKRSAQKDAHFSDKHRAEFLCFVFSFYSVSFSINLYKVFKTDF